MGSNTTNMNLFKPATSDLVDVTVDLSNNYDLIDAWADSVTPQSTGGSNVAGTAAHFARADHVHQALVTGSLLALTRYDPSPAVSKSIGATLVIVDSTNLSISFTVPASGQVLVVMSAQNINATSSVMQWCLVEGVSTIVSKSDMQVEGNAGASPYAKRRNYRALITGLTPGASKTWYWGAYGGNTGALLIGGTDGSNPNGPALMEVWSA